MQQQLAKKNKIVKSNYKRAAIFWIIIGRRFDCCKKKLASKPAKNVQRIFYETLD